MSDSEDSPSASSALYMKLSADGTACPEKLNQADYDETTRFIKRVFPKATRVQRELEQTMKRTFVLGRTEKPTTKLSQPKVSFNPQSPTVTRKVRLKLQKKIPKILKFEDFIPINQLWKNYIETLLCEEKKIPEIQARLSRADFHGALVNVSKSKCESYRDIQGIIIQETRNTFVLVTEANMTKTIPKADTIFSIQLDQPAGCAQIAGNSLLTRPGERANKKIKGITDFMINRKAYISSLSQLNNGKSIPT